MGFRQHAFAAEIEFGSEMSVKPQSGRFERRKKHCGDRAADCLQLRNRPPRRIRYVVYDGERLHIEALEPQGFHLPYVRAHRRHGKNVYVFIVHAVIKGYLSARRLHDGKTFYFSFVKNASKGQHRSCDIFLAIAIHRKRCIGRPGCELRQCKQISGVGFLGPFARGNHFDEAGRMKHYARPRKGVL